MPTDTAEQGAAAETLLPLAASACAAPDAGVEAESTPALPEPSAAAMPTPPKPEPAAHTDERQVTLTFGERRYRVRGLPTQLSEALKVNVLVTLIAVSADEKSAVSDGAALHVDTLDLYQAKQRQVFAKSAAAELKVEEQIVQRDLGRLLGCGGHVVFLRRTRVGPFSVDLATPLDALDASPEARAAALGPIEAGLAELPRLALDRNGAAILRRGQKLLLRGAGLPPEGPAYAACWGSPIAFGSIESGYFVSTRVFNLPL